ncbi:MAG TPA: hypothetical protein VII56_14475 [Rhizomicrobium sp.]
MLFVYIATPHNVEMGLSIWHALKSDSTQRDALRSALDHLDSKFSQMSEGTEWLLDIAAKLSPHRNDAAHAPTILNFTESGYVIPSWLANPSHWKRMRPPQGLRRFHRDFRDDLHTLINYADALQTGLNEREEDQTPPPPPALKSIPQGEVPLTRSQKRDRRNRRPRKPR